MTFLSPEEENKPANGVFLPCHSQRWWHRLSWVRPGLRLAGSVGLTVPIPRGIRIVALARATSSRGGKRLRQAEAGTAVLCHLLSGGERGLQAAAPVTGASRSGLSVRSEVAAGAPSLLLCPHAAAHHAGVSPRPGSAPRVSAAGDGVGGSVAEVKTDSLPEALPVSALSAGSSSRTSPSPALAALVLCASQSLTWGKRGRGSLQAPTPTVGEWGSLQAAHSVRTGFPAGPRQRASMHPPRTSEPGPIASTQQPVSPVSDSWVLCAIPGWPPGNSSRTPAWMQLLALPAVSGIRSTHPHVSFRPHAVGGPGCCSRLKRSPGHGSRSCHVCLCTARPAPVQPKDTPTDLVCGREAAVT